MTFCLYPTVRQHSALVRLLASQRHLYNAALEERRGAWGWEHRHVTWVDQFKGLTGAKVEIPSLAEFGLQPHRGTLKRLDEAFAGFFRRVKAGLTPGFPRFRSLNRWDSVQYPEATGWNLYETGEKGTYGRLALKGVGHVKVRTEHGPRSAKNRGGVPAKLVVRKRGDRWEATVFYKNVMALPQPALTGRAVGIDRGITHLAALVTSQGDAELVHNPRHLRTAESKLERDQQAMARCKRGSNRRGKAKQRVVRMHRKVAAARKDRNHQLSRRLVDEFDVIVLEDLRTLNMVRKPKPRLNDEGGFDPNGAAAKAGLNKSILDAGWGQLADMITYKAEEAGREIMFVNPRYTSQTCAACGHVDAGSRDGVSFRCLACGHSDHADLNAARNLLDRAGIPRAGPAHPRLGVKPSAA